MKLSEHYYEYSSKLRDYLTPEMCEYAVNNFIKKEIQDDGRIRYWAYIEKYNKYLRVVLECDDETIITAFFDRDFERKGRI